MFINKFLNSATMDIIHVHFTCQASFPIIEQLWMTGALVKTKIFQLCSNMINPDLCCDSSAGQQLFHLPQNVCGFAFSFAKLQPLSWGSNNYLLRLVHRVVGCSNIKCVAA